MKSYSHMNEWIRCNFSELLSESSMPNSCLIIANGPACSPSLLERVWTVCSMVICADGGANRLYDLQKDRRGDLIPNWIIGDLDSLRPEVGTFYEHAGCRVEHVQDQDTCDLEKCLTMVSSPERESAKFDRVFILNGLGGRFDQTVATLHALHRFNDKFRDILLVDDENVVKVLAPGMHTIVLHEENTSDHLAASVEDDTARKPRTSMSTMMTETLSCSLLPLGEPAMVTTTGLKWNLCSQELRLGTLISSSNAAMALDDEKKPDSTTLRRARVTVETTAPVVWTVGLSIISAAICAR